MNILSFWGSHNSSISVYNVETKKLTIIELEKIIRQKHWGWYRSRESDRAALWKSLINKVFPDNGIHNGFDWVITSSTAVPKGSAITKNELKRYGVNYKNYMPLNGHHLAHCYGAIACFPGDKAVVVSLDYGGDDGRGSAHFLDRKFTSLLQPLKSENLTFNNLLWEYNLGVSISLGSISRNTPFFFDIAGKVMGASAFGNVNNRAYQSYPVQRSRIIQENYVELKEDLVSNSLMVDKNWTQMINGLPDLSFQDQCDISLKCQHNFEEMFENLLITNGVFDILNKYDNNLILTGGSALNIVNNQKLQKKYGCKIFVPPNPNDIGISFGVLARFLYENKVISNDIVLDPTYSGIYPTDYMTKTMRLGRDKIIKSNFSVELENYIRLYKGFVKQGDVDDVVRTLRNGDVIGMIQGRSEIGLRSLGARSILADASVEGIKDKVNKIKNRELYRPFAPMCAIENAEKFFESPHYDNLYHMNINVNVREEYREKYKSITHVDNTARLQVVDEAFPKMHDILLNHSGVLLNTSLNVSGDPIMNRFIDGFKLLETSTLDFLIIYDHVKDEYVFFNKRLKHGW